MLKAVEKGITARAEMRQKREERTFRMQILRCLLSGFLGGHLQKLRSGSKNGFSMIEIIVVIVIIAIVGMLAVPMMSSAGSVQIRSAANMIAADMEYAKSMAISRQQNYSVVFDISNESYEIQDSSGDVISHPVRTGSDYVMDMEDEQLGKVNIDSVSFNGTTTVEFDYLGSPYDADSDPLNSGAVGLEADGVTMTITVEPITGFISIL